MKKEENKQVKAKEVKQKPAAADATKKAPKKKTSVAAINNIIKSATGQARANSSGSHLDDGTWVDYEEEK